MSLGVLWGGVFAATAHSELREIRSRWSTSSTEKLFGLSLGDLGGGVVAGTTNGERHAISC